MTDIIQPIKRSCTQIEHIARTVNEACTVNFRSVQRFTTGKKMTFLRFAEVQSFNWIRYALRYGTVPSE